MKKQLIIGIMIILAGIVFSGCINESNSLEVTTNPLLWIIKGEHPSYLFGTLHDPNEDIITLPSVLINAINEVDTIYTEMDISQVSIEESYTLTEEYVILSDNRTVYDILSDELINRSYNLIKDNSVVDWDNLIKFKIGWFASMLDSFAYVDDRSQLVPTLETYLIFLTTKSGKTSESLETFESYANIRNSMNQEEQIEYLNEVLNFHENQTLTLANWWESYVKGDPDELISIVKESYGDVYYQYLAVQRNYFMLERIKDVITNNPEKQFLFAIGAGHLGGEEGLIKLLENDGYNISRVEFSDSEKCDSSYVTINGRCYKPFDSNKYESVQNNFEQGLSLANNGQYLDAILEFKKVLNLDPQHAKAWYNRGLSYTYLGRYEEAIESCEKAIQIYDKYTDAWVNLGYSYHLLSELDDSLDAYNNALSIDPDSAIAWYGIGYVFSELGRDNEANDAFQKAHELDPSFEIP